MLFRSTHAETTWIGVKDFSVYIKKTADGVAVEVYAKGCEDCEALSDCYAYDLDAASMQEECAEEKDLETN